MRVLLDTNIIIHREAGRVIRQDIGTLFHWLDRLSSTKCIHPLTMIEIAKHQDPRVVATMQIKLAHYTTLATLSADTPVLTALRATYDRDDNDTIDTDLLREVLNDRVDVLISEDKKIHTKAKVLGIAERVFKIDSFLEKVVAENPELADYQVLAVRRVHFGDIDVTQPFFDSFRTDYPDFDRWFNRKADEWAYICTTETKEVLAFLYVKPEDAGESYHDITPSFAPAKRLKIGTFKVVANGYKLGERFMKIVFDNAMQQKVAAIYVTLFAATPDQARLIDLLATWGFVVHGTKSSTAGTEQVYVRDFRPIANIAQPALSYPYIARAQHKYIVPIYPEYHTELFPDSILRTESPADFVENRPNRNAISKVYISRSHSRALQPGDLLVFYRTAAGGPAYYTSVATTLGVVQEVTTAIPTLAAFIRLCRKRSVFSDAELAGHWHFNQSNRPFIVNFLYLHSFKKRLNLKELKEYGIIEEAPRGFEPLTDEAFNRLLGESHANQRFIVD